MITDYSGNSSLILTRKNNSLPDLKLINFQLQVRGTKKYFFVESENVIDPSPEKYTSYRFLKVFFYSSWREEGKKVKESLPLLQETTGRLRHLGKGRKRRLDDTPSLNAMSLISNGVRTSILFPEGARKRKKIEPGISIGKKPASGKEPFLPCWPPTLSSFAPSRIFQRIPWVVHLRKWQN